MRYRLLQAPLFVHCCHCQFCRRDTAAPFPQNAMIEAALVAMLLGEPELTLIPRDDGVGPWVARCPRCRSALWHAYGTRTAAMLYLKVCTLDQPGRFPPQAHIFTRHKLAWLPLPPDIPAFKGWYDAKKLWPAASLERWERARKGRPKA